MSNPRPRLSGPAFRIVLCFLAGTALLGRAAWILPPTVSISAPDSGPVRLAAADLAADFGRITGTPGRVVAASASAPIELKFDPGLAGPEAWRVEVRERGVVVAGSDPLGLVFGVYAFAERCLGVDPLWFWKSLPPAPRASVALEPRTFASAPPRFRYRGWFINDEDLLTEFGRSNGPRHIDYPFYARVIDPAVAERIYEALLRLGGNLVIPASFVDILNEPEADLVRRAAARGLYVSQHHVEPLGVSHFGFENYWRARGEKRQFRFSTDPDSVRAVWRAHAARWHELAGDRVIWQLGMRGRGDRPIWVDDPAIDRASGGAFISRAMADQADIVRAVDPRPEPPMTSTLFLEGAELMAAGELRFPAGTTVVFADHGPSQELQRDFELAPRLPAYRYGAYYHVAFWRRGPHLIPGVAPERIRGLFRQLEARGATAYAIANVSNLREHVLGAHVFIRTAWHGAARPLAATLDEFGPAELRPLFDAFFGALIRRADGEWLQDGTCVDAAESFLRASNRDASAASLRKRFDLAAVDAAAARLDTLAAAGLAPIPERWRPWADGHIRVQAAHLAHLYRVVSALGRNQPAAAARAVEQALAVRAALATGPWQGWYTGDRKADWPGVLARLRALPAPPAAAC